MSDSSSISSWFDRCVLVLAQGLGSGLLPKGPGTWGSLLGVAWLVLLLISGSAWIWAGAGLVAMILAVPICSRAEIILGEDDPPSVVLDEIVALPLTFLGPWLVMGTWPIGLIGQPSKVIHVFWPELLVGFLAFRLLDIAKPGPIGRIQNLPSGWGVVADDILAGLAAGVITGCVTWLRMGA